MSKVKLEVLVKTICIKSITTVDSKRKIKKLLGSTLQYQNNSRCESTLTCTKMLNNPSTN